MENKICGKCKHWKESEFPINVCDNIKSLLHKKEQMYFSACESFESLQPYYNFKFTEDDVFKAI